MFKNNLSKVIIKDKDEFNAIIEYAEENTKIIVLDKDEGVGDYPLYLFSVIIDDKKQVTLRTKCYPDKYRTETKKGVAKATDFIIKKLGKSRDDVVSGGYAYRKLNSIGNILDITDNEFFSEWLGKMYIEHGQFTYQSTARQFMWYSEEHDCTEETVYIYDVNSAFGAVLRDKVPDTFNFTFDNVVGKDEIGFYFRYDDRLTMREEGEYADIIFPLIDSPYREYVDKLFDMKKNPDKYISDKLETAEKVKLYAKQMMNYGIGCTQNHNPFFRAYIIHKSNKFIKQYIDEDTIMCNTDSIISLKERKDIPISNNIGDFKVEYIGSLRHRGHNYQSPDNEKTSLRGYIKEMLPDDFNLLTAKDSIHYRRKEYEFNREKKRVEKNV